MTQRTMAVRICYYPARIEGIQASSGVALPAAGAPEVAALAQETCVFFSTCTLSARAIAAAIARPDGVDACEGTRPAAATLLSCGSGRVLARAGKALDARRLSADTAQGARGAAVVLRSGATWPVAQPGKPVQAAAINSGMFILDLLPGTRSSFDASDAGYLSRR